MKTIVLLISLAPGIAFAQDSKISIARKKLSSGVMGAVTLFIDGKYFCELDNNSYTTHQVKPGKHKLSVQWDGREAKENALAEAIEIDAKPNEQYYLKITKEERGLKAVILLEEITPATWEKAYNSLEGVDCSALYKP